MEIPANYYISNKEFTQSISEHIAACNEAEAQGKEIPEIPKVVAKQFLALAYKLGNRFNFINYTFKDEMISNAIFACCAKIRKFDPTISQNAFAYFTNVCWRAFVDVINYEEKMSYIKAKSFQSIEFTDALAAEDVSEYLDHGSATTDFIPYFDVKAYEDKLAAAKERTNKPVAVKKPATTTQLDME